MKIILRRLVLLAVIILSLGFSIAKSTCSEHSPVPMFGVMAETNLDRGQIRVAVLAPPEMDSVIRQVMPYNDPLVRSFGGLHYESYYYFPKFLEDIHGAEPLPNIVVIPYEYLYLFRDNLYPAQKLIDTRGDVFKASYKSDTDETLRQLCSENGEQLCFPLIAYSYMLIVPESQSTELSKRPTLKDILKVGGKLGDIWTPADLLVMLKAEARSSDPIRAITYYQLGISGSSSSGAPIVIMPAVKFSEHKLLTNLKPYPIFVYDREVNTLPFNLYIVCVLKPRASQMRLIEKLGETTFWNANWAVVKAIISFETQLKLAEELQVIPANKQVRLHPEYINASKERGSIAYINALSYKKRKVFFDSSDLEYSKRVNEALMNSDPNSFISTIRAYISDMIKPEDYLQLECKRLSGKLHFITLKTTTGEFKETSQQLKCTAIKRLILILKLIKKYSDLEATVEVGDNSYTLKELCLKIKDTEDKSLLREVTKLVGLETWSLDKAYELLTSLSDKQLETLQKLFGYSTTDPDIRIVADYNSQKAQLWYQKFYNYDLISLSCEP